MLNPMVCWNKCDLLKPVWAVGTIMVYWNNHGLLERTKVADLH